MSLLLPVNSAGLFCNRIRLNAFMDRLGGAGEAGRGPATLGSRDATDQKGEVRHTEPASIGAGLVLPAKVDRGVKHERPRNGRGGRHFGGLFVILVVPAMGRLPVTTGRELDSRARVSHRIAHRSNAFALSERIGLERITSTSRSNGAT